MTFTVAILIGGHLLKKDDRVVAEPTHFERGAAHSVTARRRPVSSASQGRSVDRCRRRVDVETTRCAGRALHEIPVAVPRRAPLRLAVGRARGSQGICQGSRRGDALLLGDSRSHRRDKAAQNTAYEADYQARLNLGPIYDAVCEVKKGKENAKYVAQKVTARPTQQSMQDSSRRLPSTCISIQAPCLSFFKTSTFISPAQPRLSSSTGSRLT